MEQNTDFYKEIKTEDSSLETYINNLTPHKKLVGYLISGIIGLIISLWSYSLYFSSSSFAAGLAFIILNLLGMCCLFGATLFLKPVREQREEISLNKMKKLSLWTFVVASVVLFFSALVFGNSVKTVFGVFGVIFQLLGVVVYSLSYTRLSNNVDNVVFKRNSDLQENL
jgi:hypothetical protein